MFNALTQEIFGDSELMETAYFANKIPLYDYMLDNKEIKQKLFVKIVNEIKRDLKKYNIKGIFAFNVNYDILEIKLTTDRRIRSRQNKNHSQSPNKEWLNP